MLLQSEERYRRLVDATVEGIVIHDGRRSVDVNPSLAAMVGYTMDELIGRDPFDFIDPARTRARTATRRRPRRRAPRCSRSSRTTCATR